MFIILVSQNGHLQRFNELLATEEHHQTRELLRDNIHVVNIPASGKISESTLEETTKLVGSFEFEVWTWRSVWKRLNLTHRDLHLSRYQELLDKFPKAEGLIMFAHLGHYVYLAKLAKQRGIAVWLIEEGLATYANVGKNREVRESTLKEEIDWYFEDLKELVNNWKLRRKSNIRVDAFGFKDFDKAFLKFPEVGKEIFPKSEIIDTSRHLSLSLSSNRNAQQEKALFVGQAYEFDKNEFEAQLRFCLSQTELPIEFKLHPRMKPETERCLKQAFEEIQSPHLSICEDNRRAEQVVADGNYSTTFSITSTALLYLAADKIPTHYVSIGKFLSTTLLTHLKGDPRFTELFRDLHLFETFVEQAKLPIEFR